MNRHSLALFVSVFGASAAVAGPVPTAWTYTPSLAGDRGSAYVTDGFGARLDGNEPGGLRYYQGYTLLGPAANAGPQFGGGRVLLADLPSNFAQFYWPDDLSQPATIPTDSAPVPGGKIDARYVAAVTITDTTSGASGTVSLTGHASSGDSWLGLPASLNLEPTSNADAAVWQDLTLGGKDYRVRFLEEKVNPYSIAGMSGWDSLRVYADVQVADTPDTPEPCTLALSGFGLAGIAGAWLRRRKS